MDFEFVSHGLWEEKQNIFLQHNHTKEFWILTNKCGNKLQHENEAPALQLEPRFRVKAYFHIHWSKSKTPFYDCVEEGCSASLPITREKQT